MLFLELYHKQRWLAQSSARLARGYIIALRKAREFLSGSSESGIASASTTYHATSSADSWPRTSFQGMQRTLLSAKSELVDAQTQLKNLGTDAGEAEKGAKGMNEELKKIGQGVSWKNVSDGIGKITDKLESAGRAAIRLGKNITYQFTPAAKIIFDYEIRDTADETLLTSARTIQAFTDQKYQLILENPDFYLRWKERYFL